MSDIWQQLSQYPNVGWVPVRHHSPQCGQQIAKLMHQSWDALLIEMPVQAQEMVPFLQQPQCQAPVALYLYQQNEEGGQRGYLPFAAWSPEWRALRLAGEKGMTVECIDLPFGEGEGIDQQVVEPQLVQHPRVLPRMLQMGGCEDSDQWWDWYFEHHQGEDYFSQLAQYGALLRSLGRVSVRDDQREAHMAARIRPYLQRNQRVLVLVGAYHLQGIIDWLAKEELPDVVAAPEVGVHLLPYTLARLNRACGYGAGLPAPRYYQWVHQAMQEGVDSPYQWAMQQGVLALCQQLAPLGLANTTVDAMAATELAQRLGALRGIEAGRSEMIEALASCLFKGGDHHRLQDFLAHLQGFLVGEAVGKTPDSLPELPLVQDFRRQCRVLAMPNQTEGPKSINLDIYRSEPHRRRSHFLHRLVFLGVDYGVQVAGPNYAQSEDVTRVREVWEVRWRAEVVAQLLELSHLGDQIETAVISLMQTQLQDASVPAYRLLVAALQMGLHGHLDRLLEQVQAWVLHCNELLQLSDALVLLSSALMRRQTLMTHAYQTQLQQLVAQVYVRFCHRLPWSLGGVKSSNSSIVMLCCRCIVGLINSRRTIAMSCCCKFCKH
ncbi:hypothetical protein CHH28_12240 [Bacterioplanes sanyensis]|uniref:Uncharacterized protein n=1 Tax=Bacterioplanes sanyensis TaxID=1249553 RepID=A0A222FLJ8_9GAMM|nr:hypothetical protein CHH28_12240 [Bacterioplanes sanyensis]